MDDVIETEQENRNTPNNMGIDQVQNSPGLRNKKSYNCQKCSYNTDRKNNLKRHIATMHETCDKVLECCEQVFANKAALRCHVLERHRQGYVCRECGRNFCRKALLKRHVTVHSGQKDFSCHICGYATSHKSNLDRHRRRHFPKQNFQLKPDFRQKNFKFSKDKPAFPKICKPVRIKNRNGLSVSGYERGTMALSYQENYHLFLDGKLNLAGELNSSNIYFNNNPPKNGFHRQIHDQKPTQTQLSSNLLNNDEEYFKIKSQKLEPKDIERKAVSPPTCIESHYSCQGEKFLQTGSDEYQPDHINRKKRLYPYSYRCPERQCDKTFERQIDLLRHFAISHKSEAQYSLKLCPPITVQVKSRNDVLFRNALHSFKNALRAF